MDRNISRKLKEGPRILRSASLYIWLGDVSSV